MSDIIAAIKKLDIATSSHFDAQRSIQKKFGNCTKLNYEGLIEQLTGLNFVGRNDKESELVFNYLVIDTVKAYNESQIGTYEAHLESAKKKAADFLTKNGWILAAPETPPVAAVEGEEAPKTTKRAGGKSKKEQAIELFNKDGNKDKSRKELIEIFKKELGLSEGGASTYVHNCKKGLWK